VFSTVSQAGSDMNSSLKHFDVVIIDEATQLVEAATAIMFSPRLRCLVLAGDNKQLPATVNSALAELHGYGRSLFERLLLHDFPSSLLNTQYRMHPMISVWPNKRFYRGKIIDGENVRSSTYSKEWHSLLPPFSMYDVKGTEELDLSKSYYNRLEVSTVKSVLRSLYGILKESVRSTPVKVGVISAYKAQATLMRESMAQMSVAFDSSLISLHSSTVDGFQGQECDVIIFLCVRCNPEGSIGFLSDSRRLTVALTRAKYSLLVIGDCSTLKHHGLWSDFITYALGCGAVYDRTSLTLIKIIDDKYALEARKLASKDPLILSTLFDLSPWRVKIMEMFKRTFPSISDTTVRTDLEYCLIRLSEGKWPWKPRYPAGIEPEVGNFEEIIYSSVFNSRVLLWSLDLEVQRFRISSV
jgi:superfamily I DNA and/or RNA helicase